MRDILLYLIGATMFALGLRATVSPEEDKVGKIGEQLIIDSAMVVYLENFAETTHVEDARCIAGRMVDDSTFSLYAAFDTPWLIMRKDSTGLLFYWDLCPFGTAGWWHPHPWRYVRRWSAEQNVSPYNWCNLSLIDTRRPKPFRFAIISIRRGMSCVFMQNPDGTYQKVNLIR